MLFNCCNPDTRSYNPIGLLEFPRIPTLTGIQPCYLDHVYLILFHFRLQFVVLFYRLRYRNGHVHYPSLFIRKQLADTGCGRDPRV